MAALSHCFFDTSVLIGGIIELGEMAAPAQRLMDAIAESRIEEPSTAWHCCLEFYSVTTRLPLEYRLSPDEAVLLVSEELLGRFRVDQLPVDARQEFQPRWPARGGRPGLRRPHLRWRRGGARAT
jgi:hypothetical protein